MPQINNNIILELKDVSFKWFEELILAHTSLTINKKDFILLKGPSGSGKSTLLRLLSKLEEPSAGELLFKNVSYNAITPEELRQKVALIQQTPTVINGSVKDNLLLPFSFAVNKNLEIPDNNYLSTQLKKLYLDVSLDKEASELSVGQKQRLCILRTILLKPEILLMDEPTSALDNESKIIVENISEELNSQGQTIIMISHSTYKPSVPYIQWNLNKGHIEVKKCTEPLIFQ